MGRQREAEEVLTAALRAAQAQTSAGQGYSSLDGASGEGEHGFPVKSGSEFGPSSHESIAWEEDDWVADFGRPGCPPRLVDALAVSPSQ